MEKNRLLIKGIDEDKSYTHKEIVREMLKEKPEMSENSIQWVLNDLCRTGQIIHEGYNSYMLPGDKTRAEYVPQYSDIACELTEKISGKYPAVKFTVFETALMNDFLNHLVAQNTIFVQCEKEISDYIFRFLQEEGYKDLLYKPSKKDYYYYWSKNIIVITDMISEAPVKSHDVHAITIEKLLVDIYCDKIIKTSYSLSEYPVVLTRAVDMYNVDLTRLYRYARRRNKENEIRALMEGALDDQQR